MKTVDTSGCLPVHFTKENNLMKKFLHIKQLRPNSSLVLDA